MLHQIRPQYQRVHGLLNVRILQLAATCQDVFEEPAKYWFQLNRSLPEERTF